MKRKYCDEADKIVKTILMNEYFQRKIIWEWKKIQARLYMIKNRCKQSAEWRRQIMPILRQEFMAEFEQLKQLF